jgi:hypothetical protein
MLNFEFFSEIFYLKNSSVNSKFHEKLIGATFRPVAHRSKVILNLNLCANGITANARCVAFPWDIFGQTCFVRTAIPTTKCVVVTELVVRSGNPRAIRAHF